MTDTQLVTLVLPLAWHQQTEWEADVAYAQGFTAGIEYARLAMDTGILDACGNNMPTSARDIVQQHVRAMDRASRQPPERPEPDHPDGAIEPWPEPVRQIKPRTQRRRDAA